MGILPLTMVSASLYPQNQARHYMQPKDIIADKIAFDLAWYEKDAASETASQTVRQAARARIATFKTAPRDIPLLEMEIAIKTKAFNNWYCNQVIESHGAW